jgi:multidrug efflux system outer membrane protein
MARHIISIFLLLLLTGCVVGPDYHRPWAPVPMEWKWDNDDVSCDEEPEPVDFWWEVFHDPLLNELEQQAIAANQNLQKAIANVIEEKALAQHANAARYPHIDFDPSFTNVNSLLHLFGIPPSFGIPLNQRFHQGQYLLPINVSYEVDLWGKLLRTYRAAEEMEQASEEAFKTVLLTVTSDLANNYFTLRALDSLQRELDATIASWEGQFKLSSNRMREGLVSELDVASAEVGLSNAKAISLENRQQRALVENAIAVLVATPASDFSIPVNPVVDLPPKIPAGLPSDLLLRRPDIAEAERTMASVHEQIGIAIADYYPSINLTAATGYLSPETYFLPEYKTRYSANSTNISQLLYDAGATQAEVLAAQARYAEAVADYQETVLVAFREVEDALASLKWELLSGEALLVAQKAAVKTLELSQNRYLHGLASYLDVLVAEITLRQANTNVVNNLGMRYTSTINLIKALGGGWDSNNE